MQVDLIYCRSKGKKKEKKPRGDPEPSREVRLINRGGQGRDHGWSLVAVSKLLGRGRDGGRADGSKPSGNPKAG